MHDVIVVGARCAGATVAMLLARRGYRVLCVDQASFPRDAVSTHMLRQGGLARLRDWGLLDRLIATGPTPITSITMSYGDARFAGFADPIDGIAETYAPRRIVLDALLQDAARAAGVDLREQITVLDLVREGETVTGVVGRDRDGHLVTEHARLVIGADGYASTVAKLTGAEKYEVIAGETFTAYSYWTGLDVQSQLRIGDEQAVGGWPTHDGKTLIWCVQYVDRFAEFRTDVERNFHLAFKETAPDLAELLDSGERAERFTIARYPENFYRESHGPGWALVGDAGYHKDPFTGLGISDAFTYADLLAERAHEGLSGARPLIEALADYQAQRDKSSMPMYRFTCESSRLVLPDKHVEVMRALPSSPAHTTQWFRMMAGGLSGREFFAEENMRALFDAAGRKSS
ncbi:NAD(P)/FAD-dependent oxidoreductase [Nocardia mangyaensis]|uniref:NAD(P)/FAD-dependent oxidoreductase n=1 Tax=Nocardia mangyaensis TaxID=2213200 RepID=UPI002674DEF4|nr:NAD(P)/FAD-dependent oxidoreductase [Nocardia mangyaensis]MDO3648384.1 NAD(P)/FAD-dependent oxidoreductase [Nocardia mangyaensis]